MKLFFSRLLLAFIVFCIALLSIVLETLIEQLASLGFILSSAYWLISLFSKELPIENAFSGYRYDFITRVTDHIIIIFLGIFYLDITEASNIFILFLSVLLSMQVLLWLSEEFDKLEKIILLKNRSAFQLHNSIFIYRNTFSLFLLSTIFIFSIKSNNEILFYSFLSLFILFSTLCLALIFQSGKFLLRSWWKKIQVHLEHQNFQIVLYGSGPPGAAYQLNQWLSVLEKTGLNVLVVVGEKHFLDDLNPTSLPVVYYKTIADLDIVIPSTVRVVLYPAANSAKNSQLLRKENIKHIFINHGESDKSVNESKFLQSYDKLYVAGEIAKARLERKGLYIHDIALVGRPQLVDTLNISNTTLSSEQEITLLYAPTWEGFFETSNYSSVLPNTVDALSKLLTNPNIHLLFKPHSYTGLANPKYHTNLKLIEKLLSNHPQAEICSNEDIFKLMNRSDMMLCDVSSVMNDYLYTSKPIIMTNPKGLNQDAYHTEFPTSQAAYILDKNTDNLQSILDDILSGDSLAISRKQFRTLSLGHQPELSFELFTKELLSDLG